MDSAQHGGREEAGMEGSTAVKMAKVLVLTEGLRSSQLDGGASRVALVVKNLPANAGDIRDMSSIPGLGRIPGGGHGNPLQCSCWRIPVDRGTWCAIVHGVAKSQTRLSDAAHTGACLGLPWWLRGKESTCSAGDADSICGSGRFPGEGNGNPPRYSFLENSMDRGAWQATVHAVAKSWT